ncbi:hypothetical protein SC09_Contig17orf00177 [Bacillus subtilis]|uniref:Uncharacterized protein n=1 Tax=Bacillus subtilis TaxID=1423 RepID=A0A0D1KWH3_BACIU|nr:hypothetical protein SC09_Contig17orf00177 [Bacillus subtilis]
MLVYILKCDHRNPPIRKFDQKVNDQTFLKIKCEKMSMTSD